MEDFPSGPLFLALATASKSAEDIAEIPWLCKFSIRKGSCKNTCGQKACALNTRVDSSMCTCTWNPVDVVGSKIILTSTLAQS